MSTVMIAPSYKLPSKEENFKKRNEMIAKIIAGASIPVIIGGGIGFLVNGKRGMFWGIGIGFGTTSIGALLILYTIGRGWS